MTITEVDYHHDYTRRYKKLDGIKVFPSDFFDIMTMELGEAQLKEILRKYVNDEEGFKVAELKHPKATQTEV